MRTYEHSPHTPRSERLAEHRELMKRRWTELPEVVRTPTQLAGVGGVACGATHGILERCNFACTSCYLTDVANRTPALPFEEVRAQLDELRTYLGPGGKTQITAGEVTLLPLEELGRIVAYARSIDLDPMVMTHGERFLEEPEYLHALMQDYGLRKVSIHIDVMQKGRRFLEPGMSERDLRPLRDRFADVIRAARAATGRALHAAHTVTITQQNLEEVPDIVDWALDNADAFRLLSFQPVAEVGRTRDRFAQPMAMDELWERICRPIGRVLNRDAMQFGHRECNVTVPVAVARAGDERRVFEVVRAESKRDAAFFGNALRVMSSAADLNGPGVGDLLRVGANLARHPLLLARGASYALRRAWSDRSLAGFLARKTLRGKRPSLRPLLLVVHKFMDAAELATPLGRERLEACVFKLPVNGRMVSMCELNASGLRRELNESAGGRSGASRTARTSAGKPTPVL